MQLHPIPAFDDNYIWAYSDAAGHTVIVDPGQAQPVLDWLAREQRTLSAVLITHHHGDHVGGLSALLAAHPAPVYGPAHPAIPWVSTPVADGDQITLTAPAVTFSVLAVPGHTLTHLAFFTADGGQPVLFPGDTLFASGCGRLFEGTPAQMLASLDRLATLPADTRVCCAHEYSLSNVRFARAVLPTDSALAARQQQMEAQRAAQQPTLPVTLADELLCNPFLRADDPRVQQAVASESGQPVADRTATFAALRAWKDRF